MAAVLSDCFTLGSIIWCRTRYNQEIEGEVLAFDLPTKMLVLKCPATSGITNLNDVNFVNLSFVRELQVKKEVTTVPEIPQSINLQRINTRIHNQIEEKKRLLTAMSSSVSPEGQRLFLTIYKVIRDVRWIDSDIVVWENKVTISPPYQLENMRGNVTSNEFLYVRKIVEKFMKDTALSQTSSSVNNPQVVQHAANMQ